MSALTRGFKIIGAFICVHSGAAEVAERLVIDNALERLDQAAARVIRQSIKEPGVLLGNTMQAREIELALPVLSGWRGREISFDTPARWRVKAAIAMITQRCDASAVRADIRLVESQIQHGIEVPHKIVVSFTKKKPPATMSRLPRKVALRLV